MKFPKYRLVYSLLVIGLLILSYLVHVENLRLESQIERLKVAAYDNDKLYSITAEGLELTRSDLETQIDFLRSEVNRRRAVQQAVPSSGPSATDDDAINRLEVQQEEALRRERVARMSTPEVRETTVSRTLDVEYGDFIDSLGLSPAEEDELSSIILKVLDDFFTVRIQLANEEISIDEYRRYPLYEYMAEAVSKFLAPDELERFIAYQSDAEERYADYMETIQMSQIGLIAPRLSEESRGYLARLIVDELSKLRAGVTTNNPGPENNKFPIVYSNAKVRLFEEAALNSEQLELALAYIERRISMDE